MRRRRLIGCSAVVLIGLGLLTLDRHLARVERSWKAMVAATEQAEAELESRPTARPVLWGEARPGNAAEDYQRAVELSFAVSDAHGLQVAWRTARHGQDRSAESEARNRFADALRPALEAVREGAHRTDYRNLADGWQAASPLYQRDVLAGRLLVNAATATAERLALDGRDLEAARWLLDAAQFSRDRMHRPLYGDEVIGIAMLAITTRGALFDHGVAERLDSEARRLVGDGLARLDQDLEAGLALRGETVFASQAADQGSDFLAGQLEHGPLSAWREGFSTRLAVSKLQLAKLAYAARHDEIAGLPAAERDPLEAAARARFLSSAGPLGGILSEVDFRMITCRREAIANLRLCRMMLAPLNGEDPEPLADPFGGTLHAARYSDDSLHTWSDRPGDRPLELVVEPEARASSPR